jgi:hypothetical protein
MGNRYWKCLPRELDIRIRGIIAGPEFGAPRTLDVDQGILWPEVIWARWHERLCCFLRTWASCYADPDVDGSIWEITMTI